MGYAENGLKAGNTMVTPQFMDVSMSGGLALQSIKPTGDDVSDNIYISTLDAFGYTDKTYGWINWAGESGDQEAWVDADTFEIVDISFQPGVGLWVQASSNEQGVQSAGKVGRTDVSVQLRAGNTAVGNPFPISVSLQDIVVLGEDTSDNVYISTLDAFGYTDKTYGWINWAGESGDQEAWVDADTFEIVDISFLPGAGLWIQASSDGQSIRFPAPEL